jgi:ABC-type glycerol-3-phosphate transport system permease component
LSVTTYYAVLAVPFTIIFSLLLAVLLNQKIKGQVIFRTLYYTPTIISGVSVAFLWSWLLNSKDMDEAVKSDGGGYFTMFFRIILPLSIPAVATSAILEFMYRWNDLIGPLIYLSSDNKYPLSLGLANFTEAYGATPWNLLMAASIVAVLPPLLLFFFSQKYFIQGIVISASKG